MLKLLVAGPESSGTKQVAYVLKTCGAEVTHRSYPHGGGPRPDVFWWPADQYIADSDAIVFVSRDLYATCQSQIQVGHVDTVEKALANIRTAHFRIADQAFRYSKPIYYVTLESLQNPGAVEGLCLLLGLEYNYMHEPVADPNAKYYGGSYFSDHRPVEDR